MLTFNEGQLPLSLNMFGKYTHCVNLPKMITIMNSPKTVIQKISELLSHTLQIQCHLAVNETCLYSVKHSHYRNFSESTTEVIM